MSTTTAPRPAAAWRDRLTGPRGAAAGLAFHRFSRHSYPHRAAPATTAQGSTTPVPAGTAAPAAAASAPVATASAAAAENEEAGETVFCEEALLEAFSKE